MRSYIETWHQNELNRQMLRFYKLGTVLILVIGLILLTEIGLWLSLLSVLSAKLFGMLVLFFYWKQKKEDYRPTAFMLDKRFDGHDFFPTVLEFTPASGVVHEQFTEMTKARFAQIMPDGFLVDLKKELKYFWFQALVILILLLLLSLLAAAAAAAATNSESNQGTEQSQPEQNQNQDQNQSQGQNQNSDSGSESPNADESESESESQSESGGEQESESQSESESGSESESESESEGEKESELESSAQEEQSSGDQAQPETEQAVELSDEKAEGEPDATVSSDKSPEVTEVPPDLPHLETKPKPSELVMPQIPQEEEQDEGKYDSKAYGVLGSGDAGEIQKFEDSLALKRQTIKNTQQKLEGFLSRPNVPKEYKERLKRLFESREQYKEDL
ncbi:MAG: hypothetical protein H3C47_07520 [Candidatus Cloacimonetes bacterium]|nr:hypothetical protein [Candidatus Cloacimonadota bacterium]